MDLPSLRSREIRVPHGWDRLVGLDDRGRVLYQRSVPYTSRFELHLIDAVSSDIETVVALEKRWWKCSMAPSGGTAAVWEHDGNSVDLLDLESRARRAIDVGIGEIHAVNWLADGSALALDGSAGSAIVDVASGMVSKPSSTPFGLFSPESETFLTQRDGMLALVERTTGRTLVAPAQLPWQHGTQIRAFGMCGRQLVLYPALPTAGKPVSWSYGRRGSFASEDPVLKVCDLVSGSYATLLPLEGEVQGVLYSPHRISALASQ